jgi:hypothetical protein
MNEAQALLRISGQGRELARVFQSQLLSEQAEAIQELDGVGIGHE